MRVRAVSVSLVVVGFVIGAAAILLADPGSNGPSANAAAVSAGGSVAADGHVHTTGALTGGTACEQSGPEAATGSSHGHRGAFPWTTPTGATRDELVAQLTAAHSVTIEYPTVATAEAAGYRMTTTYVPCIGAHYINGAYLGGFDLAHPAMLLYDGTTPDAKIVGLSYASMSGKAPPDGFAGDNDLWHQHNLNGGLCIKGGVVVGAESTSKADCEARGGAKVALSSLWMMHAWVADGWPSSWGVFSAEHPDLGGRIGQIDAAPDPNAKANPGD
jgi:hypothetical protein